ncbi:MAG: META domain-containing protein [Candidatus Electrothrix sp. AW3_4]|nr:META domain-containing protein [Candidatus Electrothrix gigas]
MRIYLRLFSLLVLFLFLAGCAPQQIQKIQQSRQQSQQPQQAPQTQQAPQKHTVQKKTRKFMYTLPAVFYADMATKEYPSISFELVLRPDKLYFLEIQKDTFENTPVEAEVGVWSYNPKKNTVRLTSYKRSIRIFAVTEEQTLKLIKTSGGMMPSLLGYDFAVTDTRPRYEGVVRMQGMYTRQRGRGIFRECLSGAGFPLVGKRRMKKVRQAYQDILHDGREALFITQDVRFSTRAGRGDRLVAIDSVSIDPDRVCGQKKKEKKRKKPRSTRLTIANSRWSLLQVYGKKLEPDTLKKRPFLKIQRGKQRIQGFAGCNEFTGSWLFNNNRFMLRRIPSTRMACPLGMTVEYAFLQALDNTRKYTIKGNILRLYDGKGKVIAKLRYSRQLTDLDFNSSLPPAKEDWSPAHR